MISVMSDLETIGLILVAGHVILAIGVCVFFVWETRHEMTPAEEAEQFLAELDALEAARAASQEDET